MRNVILFITIFVKRNLILISGIERRSKLYYVYLGAGKLCNCCVPCSLDYFSSYLSLKVVFQFHSFMSPTVEVQEYTTV